MKNKYLLIAVTFAIAALTACKKDTRQLVAPKSNVLLPITGTWLETKLRCYSIDINSNIVSDTTYTHSAFSESDYFKAKNDSICMLSADYVFNGFAKGYPIMPSAAAIENFNYYFAGPYEYALTKAHPAITAIGFYGITVTTPDSQTVLIKSVYRSGAGVPTPLNFPYYRTISEAYYTKQ